MVPAPEVPDIMWNVNSTEKINIMKEVYFLWHMPEEIQEVRNFLFVITGREPNIWIDIILVSERFMKDLM